MSVQVDRLLLFIKRRKWKLMWGGYYEVCVSKKKKKKKKSDMKMFAVNFGCGIL
ncbi:hypothetical protein HanRHA438_Chr04g0154501 [Helianthus annuus]|uniref:Uncharacterized protein n=1 Tax=Helianthus annuus TaxID=4232 RepID=A0A9K3J3I0_HELAN|nr:hypothetical protein HanXRQr2_Chr04g0142841 [Helianthus annuus]KAJ0586683.1 hypothetical protein HanIR_Chr04g0154581 [Helianthus annuus]KAJ0924981.1 hypothetical protein HanRHA438_Chr04g0154501 [Helianthus annuus]KAJ0929541.1 hypothetical protein HanPSC8_Chr04g0138831 [Helianthus annuus]